MADEYVAEDTELRLTIKTRSIPLCRCPTLKPRLMTVWIDRSSKIFDVKKRIQTDFCKAHEGITTARMSLAYPRTFLTQSSLVLSSR